MYENRHHYAQLEMLFGIFVGSGLSIVLFANSGNALYFTLVGLGVGFGLSFGAIFDKKRNKS